MAGEIEAAGALATAGLAVDALDHPAPGAPAAGGRCINCEAVLAGSFCSRCGQKAHVPRTLTEIGHDILHGITHFDGKTWTTLPLLVFRPGLLTRDYIRGRRARYIGPVPLFLLVIFLMFFVFSFVTVGDTIGTGANDRVEARRSLVEASQSLAELDRRIAAARSRGDAEQLAGLSAGREVLVRLRDDLARRARGEAGMPVTERLTSEVEAAVATGQLKADFGIPYIDARLNKALRNPSLTLYKLQSKAYKLSFLLVPLSLPWLWLMFFWRRDIHMYDHAVFALYSISFMSLLFVLASIALALHVTTQWFWVPLILVAPVAHIYAQLKGAYRLSVAGAAIRTFILINAAQFTLGLFLVLLLALGIFD